MPVEVQACGKPVIAFGEGGVLDTVAGPTTENYESFSGIKSDLFFTKQTPEAIRSALEIFSGMEFDSEAIISQSKRFSKEKFVKSMENFISKAYEIYKKNGRSQLEEQIMT